MQSNQTGVEKFFATVGGAIKNFFVTIWNVYVSLLSKVFPEDFAMMIAIVSLVILVLAIFMGIINKK